MRIARDRGANKQALLNDAHPYHNRQGGKLGQRLLKFGDCLAVDTDYIRNRGINNIDGGFIRGAQAGNYTRAQ